ncbi:MAG: hypothetical protein WC292_00200 [Clostridia bacterium]
MKQEQKELKVTYKKELAKKWGTDQKMIDYCAKHAAYVLEHGGKLYKIGRPDIKKDFCFGFGQNGISDEEDTKRASGAAANARTNEEYFISQNLKDINHMVEELEKIKNNISLDYDPNIIVMGYNQYMGQPENCRLAGWSIIDTFRQSPPQGEKMDIDFIDKLLKGFAQVKADFEKRLKTYLKRYGLTKINSWTYLVD